MNSKITYCATFAAGIIFGAVTAVIVVKDKYRQMAEEEIASVKETFRKNRAAADSAVNKDESFLRKYSNLTHDETLAEEYGKVITNENYISKDSKKQPETKPYIIEEHEVGAFDEYSLVELMYFPDVKMLTDDNFDPINDPIEIIGEEALKELALGEVDELFVRCDERKCDYEILIDLRGYDQVTAYKPRRIEV